ncbi:MAG: hypothetical protein H7A25_17125 [Leptospiraceae bacterium]|nr:hypothetical protein [Leptospiraceae bacterium]MCP5501628.1 hypothetical protein [Leptospiraceae bacterium]
MFKWLFPILMSLFLLFSGKPVSIEDRAYTFLYVCDPASILHFEKDGSLGLSTLSEYKRREEARIFGKYGKVFLFGTGDILSSAENSNSLLHEYQKTGFDALFLSASDLKLLETGDNPLTGLYPIFSHRENNLKIPGEKIFSRKDETFLFSSVSTRFSGKINADEFNLSVVFLQRGELPTDYTILSRSQNPVFFIFRDAKDLSYSFYKNHYYASCSKEPGYIGKISLYFREGRLIRNQHEFLPLNTKDRERSWVKPDRKIKP